MPHAIIIIQLLFVSELWPFDCFLCLLCVFYILVHSITHSLFIKESLFWCLIVTLTISLLAVTCRLLITFANNLDPDQD